MKQCSNCNTMNDDSSNYCKNCGQMILVRDDIPESKYLDKVENNTVTESTIPKNKIDALKSYIAKLISEIKNKNIKVICACVAVILLLAVIFSSALNNSTVGLSKEEKIAVRDIKTMQRHLKDPDSIIIYECYVSTDYGDDGKEITYISFGSKNGFGGIVTDEACICNKLVEFDSQFNEAANEAEYYREYSDDNDEILSSNNKVLSYKYLPYVSFQLFANPDKFTEIDSEKIEKAIK